MLLFYLYPFWLPTIWLHNKTKWALDISDPLLSACFLRPWDQSHALWCWKIFTPLVLAKHTKHRLVGGFNMFQPLWKIWVSWDHGIPNIWKVIWQPCSKSPTSGALIWLHLQFAHKNYSLSKEGANLRRHGQNQLVVSHIWKEPSDETRRIMKQSPVDCGYKYLLRKEHITGAWLKGWGHSQVAFGSILAELPWLINLKSGNLGIVIVDPSFRLIYALKCLAPSWRDKKKRGSGYLNSIKSVGCPSNFTQCIGLGWGFINHDHEIIPFNQTMLTPFWKPRWTPS